MRGSGGGDAWCAEELRYLPQNTWELFRTIAGDWLQKGQVPAPLRVARTVFLPKESKLQDGQLKAGDGRPITILSCWWRFFTSTWLHSEHAKNWYKQILHPSVVYGAASDAQISAGRLLAEYSQDGFLCTLDYTKCFDCLRPECSVQIFKQTGLSGQFCNLLTDMWTEHTRWCSWNGAVHPVPMVTHGMPIPQGECLGPLTCCLWLSAGQRFVDQQLQENLKSSIFMDDRSFVAKDADTLVEARSACAMWSSKVGLFESLPKIQMTAKSMRQKTELQSLIPENWFQQEVTMLGVVSRGGRRTNAATEEARFAKAKARLNVLAGLRLDSNLVAVYSRIFAVSLCSYGWIARLPVKKDVDAIWKLIKKGQKVLRSSNTWLRCMVHGGISHLSPICACNLFRVVATIKCRYQITWTRVGGSPVAALRK